MLFHISISHPYHSQHSMWRRSVRFVAEHTFSYLVLFACHEFEATRGSEAATRNSSQIRHEECYYHAINHPI